MLTHGVLFVSIVCLSAVLGWLPASLLVPIRKSELRVLFKVSTEGPGGFDDAVQVFVMNRPDRYSVPVVEMLRKSQPGSNDEEVGLFFVEFVRGAEVDPFLREFAAHHPNPKVRKFVDLILCDSVAP